MVSRTSAIPWGSSPLIGSSRTRRSGSPTSASPIPRRCFIPREKCFVFFFPTPSSPTVSKISSMYPFFRIPNNSHIIPYNSTEKNDYQKPSGNSIMRFKSLLEQSGKKVTVRLERGADIDAACGQLRGKVD